MTEREPIFHDRQNIALPGPIITSSITFVPIPNAVITTKDLGGDGIYLGWLSLNIQHSNNNSTVTFQPVINGVNMQERVVNFGPGSAGDPRGRTFIAQSDAVPPGSTILFKWKTSGGTAQINELRMMVDGIPEIRMLE